MSIVRHAAAATFDRSALDLAPLGVPLRVECPRAAEPIAAACWGWEGQADPAAAPLRLRIDVSSELSGVGQVVIEADSARLTLRGSGAAGYADVASGFASCAVSAAYLQHPRSLRDNVLEPLVLMLLTRRDRTPVHASAFIVDDLAILLAGRTGSGKSCLARAADAAGLQVLSDDTVYVQLTPQLTVWGWPTAAHLLPGDAPQTVGPVRWRHGTMKHVVPFRSAAQAAIACDAAVLCLLSSSRDGDPGLRPLSGEEVAAGLWPLDEGFDLLPGPIAAAVASLSVGGAWELRLSDDPAEAIRLLVANRHRLRELRP
jgi:hypothetical protein